VNLVSRDNFERSQITAQGALFPTLSGSREGGGARRFGGYRFLGVGSAGPNVALVLRGGDLRNGRSVLHPEKLRRYNLFREGELVVGSRRLALAARARLRLNWTGSGQIPARLVDAGMLDRFGSIDPSEGGDTQRQQAIATLVVRPDRSSSLTAVASVTRYALTLFNDFTFQAIDPQNGDAIEQDDRRTTLYAGLRYERSDRLPAGALLTTLGAQVRNDDVDAGFGRCAIASGCRAAFRSQIPA